MPTTLELAKAHSRAEDRQDLEATLATFSNDCEYSIEAFGIELKGKEQIGQHYSNTFAAFPDFVNKEVIWFDAGDDVFGKALVEFTHDSVWTGLQPTGKKISFWSFAHFPRARDGLLAAEHIYMNANDFLHKLGALPSANAFEIA